MADRDELKGSLLVLAAGMCWGLTGTVQAFAPAGASPLTVGAARVTAAGIIMALWAFFRQGRSFFSGSWNFKGLFIAALGLIAYQLTFFSAVKLTGVAIGTMIAIGSSPAMAGILGRIAFKERLKPRWYAATVMAVAGCSALALSGGTDGIKISILGIFLAFSAGFSYALEGYGLRLAAGRTPFETITAVTVLSSLMGLPWLIIGDVSWIAEPSGFAAVMTLALVSSVFPYCFFASGLKRITMGKAYTLSLSEPMTAWILSSLLLGERLSFVGIAGVLVLFSGIILLACDQNK